VANLLSRHQLLDSLWQRWPALNEVYPCLGYDLAADWARALGTFCRIAPHRLRALDLRRQFKGQALDWLVQDPEGQSGSGVSVRRRILHPFCVACLRIGA
jgi:hypothetical protein